MCGRFVMLCPELKLFSQALVAIDDSKFKAVNTRDRNFTEGKVDKRQKQIEECIQWYLNALETADRPHVFVMSPLPLTCARLAHGERAVPPQSEGGTARPRSPTVASVGVHRGTACNSVFCRLWGSKWVP
ncbi:hypothetical protein R54767_04038 [Paraburkholderia gardini]|uniref:SOS response associated peptidase (SRAP) n=1 Tax=Paraburkholderia gardini TaxID=2823469 RepID=A0ABM8U7Y2_9BURK|nr:hypothetical protein R54767_04038 [Paraburkholderia gardini]